MCKIWRNVDFKNDIFSKSRDKFTKVVPFWYSFPLKMLYLYLCKSRDRFAKFRDGFNKSRDEFTKFRDRFNNSATLFTKVVIMFRGDETFLFF